MNESNEENTYQSSFQESIQNLTLVSAGPRQKCHNVPSRQRLSAALKTKLNSKEILPILTKSATNWNTRKRLQIAKAQSGENKAGNKIAEVIGGGEGGKHDAVREDYMHK